MEIDKKNKEIIYELGNNARISYTSLAKQISLSSESVSQRIKTLELKGFISKYITHVNFHKLGYIDFGLFIRCNHTDKEEEFISYVKNNSSVSYFTTTGGNFDYVIGILAKSPLEFNTFLNELLELFSDVILQKEVITRLSLQHFPRKYLLEKKDQTKNKNFGGEIEEIPLDNIDKKILKILSENAREKVLDIARELNTTHSTIISRIKNLEKKEIITGFSALINPKMLQMHNYSLHIKVSNLSIEEEKKLISNCSSHKNITWFIKTLGNWDYEIGVEISNQEELQTLLSNLRIVCPKIISIEFLLIFKTLKYSLYPFNS